MAIFEVTARITRRSLMNKSKSELAFQVLDCLDRNAAEKRRIAARIRKVAITLGLHSHPACRDGYAVLSTLADELEGK